MADPADMLKIELDLSIYELELRGAIGSDLTALEIIYEQVSNPAYTDKNFILKQGITIAQISVPPIDFIKRREINKCLKSVVGSFQDYMDKLIAILRLKTETISIEPGTTQEKLSAILVELFEKHLLEVSTDRSLNVPLKLNLLLDKPEHQIHKQTIQSYFDLRNGLEHHKGIAKSDRIILYKRIGLASTEGYEVHQPCSLGEGEGLILKTFDEEIKYDKGGDLLITKEQLDSIILNLIIFIIPAVQTSIAGKL